MWQKAIEIFVFYLSNHFDDGIFRDGSIIFFETWKSVGFFHFKYQNSRTKMQRSFLINFRLHIGTFGIFVYWYIQMFDFILAPIEFATTQGGASCDISYSTVTY